MREKLSSRERVITAIDHREPDRLPIQFYATPEVRKLLIDYFKRQNLEEILEVDFRGIESRYLGKLKKSIPGSGIDAYDMWGVGYRNCPYHLDVMGAHMDSISVSGTYPEPVYMPFAGIKTMDEVAAYPWPNPDDFDYSVIEEQIERNKGFAIVLGADIPDIITGLAARGRGLEQLLIDIALQDEVGMAIIDGRINFYYEYLRRSLEAGQGKIDIVHLCDDLGTQKGLIISPEMFDAVLRPRYQKLIDLTHKYGAKAWFHSCGSTYFLHSRFIDMDLVLCNINF